MESSNIHACVIPPIYIYHIYIYIYIYTTDIYLYIYIYIYYIIQWRRHRGNRGFMVRTAGFHFCSDRPPEISRKSVLRSVVIGLPKGGGVPFACISRNFLLLINAKKLFGPPNWFWSCATYTLYTIYIYIYIYIYIARIYIYAIYPIYIWYHYICYIWYTKLIQQDIALIIRRGLIQKMGGPDPHVPVATPLKVFDILASSLIMRDEDEDINANKINVEWVGNVDDWRSGLKKTDRK